MICEHCGERIEFRSVTTAFGGRAHELCEFLVSRLAERIREKAGIAARDRELLHGPGHAGPLRFLSG